MKIVACLQTQEHVYVVQAMATPYIVQYKSLLLFSPYRADCKEFDVKMSDLKVMEDVKRDLEQTATIWKSVQEFENDINKVRGEDWLTFR